jgi:iron(III) transport system ATP-binding protein
MNKPASKLVVEDLHLQYGDNKILQGVSMTLNPGEVVALLGASGSGKTTLLRSVAGLEQPSRGRISIGDTVLYDGANGVEMPVEKRNLGLVFQSYALWPHRSVFDNIAYGLRLRGVPASEIDSRVNLALTNLGLGALATRLPHQLSGGQQQRVAIARALVYNPPVVLMDEPLSNLDAKLREEARAWLRELIVRLGLSALVVTHDQTEAMAMSDKILLLNAGRIEQQGTPEDLYNRPQTQFTAEFMGSNNRLPAKVLERDGGLALLQVEGGDVKATLRGPTICSGDKDAVAIIRVEQVNISDTQVDNAIRLPLSTCMYLGDRWECVFRNSAASGADSTVLRAYARHRLAPGEYWLQLPQEALWAF